MPPPRLSSALPLAGCIRRYHPADRKARRPTPPGVMARSIVSSPVDPIKDYGETIVACAARTAALPPAPADATASGYIRDGFYVNGETFDPARRDAERHRNRRLRMRHVALAGTSVVPHSPPPRGFPQGFHGDFQSRALFFRVFPSSTIFAERIFRQSGARARVN